MKYLALLPAFLLLACNPPADPQNPSRAAGYDAYTKKTLPAKQALANLRVAVAEAQADMLAWVQTPGPSDAKAELEKFVNTDYPALRSRIEALLADSAFNASAGAGVTETLVVTDGLIGAYKELMGQLATIENYNDPAVMLPAKSMALDDDGACTIAYGLVANHLTALETQLELTAKFQLEQLKPEQAK